MSDASKLTPKKKTEKKSVGNQNGGVRPGSGRKKGTPNKKTAETIRKVEESGVTPLEFMLNIMRKPDLGEFAEPAQIIAHNAMRFEAAKAAAPYVHAKLAAVEVTGKDGGALVIQVVDFAAIHKTKV